MTDSVAHTPSGGPANITPIFSETILLTVLTANMFLGFTDTQGLAPLLVDLANDFHTSVGAMGQLAAATALPWAILAPVMGLLSDRLGRRPVLAVGTVFMGIFTMLSSLAWSYESLILLRLLLGIAGATSGPIIMSSAADCFPPNRRGQAMGIILAGQSFATVFGVPALAMVSAFAGWRSAFQGLGFLLFLMGIATWVVFPRIRPNREQIGYASGMMAALNEKPTPPLLVANMLERVSYTSVSVYLASFLMQSYALRLDQTAPILSAIAAGTIFGSILGGRLADRGRQSWLYAGCQILNAAIVAPLFLLTPGVVTTGLLAASFGIISASGRPSWMALITRVPAARRGATMGFTATTNQFGTMLGASVGGLMVGMGSYGPVGLMAAAAAVSSAMICQVGASRMAVWKVTQPEQGGPSKPRAGKLAES